MWFVFIRIQQETPDSPVSSCVSMKSDHSLGHPLTFKDENRSYDKR